ncbi:MAG: hypothetical protein WC350_06075 [Candidatus Micrarchaeia archaeon]|jgi:uncharacterized Zn finger protein (UPF0148 family)
MISRCKNCKEGCGALAISLRGMKGLPPFIHLYVTETKDELRMKKLGSKKCPCGCKQAAPTPGKELNVTKGWDKMDMDASLEYDAIGARRPPTPTLNLRSTGITYERTAFGGGTTATSGFPKGVLDKNIERALNNQCPNCGYPMPTAMELLDGRRNFICPSCNKDNAPPSEEDSRIRSIDRECKSSRKPRPEELPPKGAVKITYAKVTCILCGRETRDKRKYYIPPWVRVASADPKTKKKLEKGGWVCRRHKITFVP